MMMRYKFLRKMLKNPHNSWHRLRDTTERYLILEGRGRVKVGAVPPEGSRPGAVVLLVSRNLPAHHQYG